MGQFSQRIARMRRHRPWRKLGARGLGLPGDFNTRLLVLINGERVNVPIFDAGRFSWIFHSTWTSSSASNSSPGPAARSMARMRCSAWST
jgi:hypothetical protein